MLYSLIHYPEIDDTDIQAFRKKHDPLFELVRPHVSIVFPFTASDPTQAIDHITHKLRPWKPFDIRLTGLEKAWDNWLFLLLDRGKQEIIELHDQMYTGPLAPFLRNDIEFIPHLSLGLFNAPQADYAMENPTALPLDEERYRNALTEAKTYKFDYLSTVHKLHLVALDENFTHLTDYEEFALA